MGITYTVQVNGKTIETTPSYEIAKITYREQFMANLKKRTDALIELVGSDDLNNPIHAAHAR